MTSLHWEVRNALRLSREALELMPRECRFHGERFGTLGWTTTHRPQPRCDSCKLPWRVVQALAALKVAEGLEDA